VEVTTDDVESVKSTTEVVVDEDVESDNVLENTVVSGDVVSADDV
jgi:hypothetical protein